MRREQTRPQEADCDHCNDRPNDNQSFAVNRTGDDERHAGAHEERQCTRQRSFPGICEAPSVEAEFISGMCLHGVDGRECCSHPRCERGIQSSLLVDPCQLSLLGVARSGPALLFLGLCSEVCQLGVPLAGDGDKFADKQTVRAGRPRREPSVAPHLNVRGLEEQEAEGRGA